MQNDPPSVRRFSIFPPEKISFKNIARRQIPNVALANNVEKRQ